MPATTFSNMQLSNSRVTTIMKNMATIIQAFENDKQYEIELISTYIIPYFRLVVYGVLTTKLQL